VRITPALVVEPGQANRPKPSATPLSSSKVLLSVSTTRGLVLYVVFASAQSSRAANVTMPVPVSVYSCVFPLPLPLEFVVGLVEPEVEPGGSRNNISHIFPASVSSKRKLKMDDALGDTWMCIASFGPYAVSGFPLSVRMILSGSTTTHSLDVVGDAGGCVVVTVVVLVILVVVVG